MQAAPDEDIFELAARDGRIIVSADTDFGTILALREATKPSVILIRRSSGRRPDAQAALLLRQLPQIADSLERGSVVVIEDERVRIRSLPIGGDPER